MSDHLPECPITVHKDECCYDHPLFGFPCWCSALRACERRVLNAARQAVVDVGVRKDTSHDMRVQALAAIDALRDPAISTPDDGSARSDERIGNDS